MEKHKCKLCLRSFANGRALGGHMRSHMMNLPVPPKEQSEFVPIQLSFEADSSPSQSSSSFYGLRENPKKSFRLSDPEFSLAAAADTTAGSVILQDRESETESSRINPTRRRSKRPWQQLQDDSGDKKLSEFNENNNNNECASSVSDATTDEDVAFCLMMLSRDKWNDKYRLYEREAEAEIESDDEEDEEENDEDDGYESEEMKSLKKSNKVRGRYKCETCDKVFRSYQALGGHRASHKKIKLNYETLTKPEVQVEHLVVEKKKIHECPVCFRVFASGQALGGHKRTHVIGSATVTTAAATATVSVTTLPTVTVRASARVGDSLIDLNLPAPTDDDDEDHDDDEEENFSQFDDSAVSDAEFVKL